MDISIVIPAKNEAHKLVKCLDSILSQSLQPIEVIVIDSGSTDGTQDLVKKYKNARLVEIPPEEFNHGGTRNLGAQLAKGDYILYTVQDARGYDDDWVKKLAEAFEYKDVVAVSGSQVVPHEKEANPAEWFHPYSKPQIETYKFTPEQFESLPPAEKRALCGFDNVNSMYLREILLKHPFPKVMDSEDLKWAKKMYMEGYTLAFNKGSRVYHYHTENAEYIYRRTLLGVYISYDEFKLVPDVPKRSLKEKLSLLKQIFTATGLSMSDKFKWVDYNRITFKSLKKAIKDFRSLLSESEGDLEERCKELTMLGVQRV